MKYLFRCAIGPVQEFIAAARRSRDLQYGSWLLSELAKAGARAIAKAEGLESLIFPAPKAKSDLEPGSALNVPNVIQAIITTSPETLGTEVEQAIRQRLNDLAAPVFQRLERTSGQNFRRAVAERQIADLLEFYWVAVPLTEDYKQARRQATTLLAVRKNTRNFSPSLGEMVPKSSLDASRESVIDEKAYPDAQHDSPEVQKEKIIRLYQVFGARRGERLSGVDLLKRLGEIPQKSEFPSTSKLAAEPFIEGLTSGAWDEIRRNLRSWVNSWANGSGSEIFKDNDAILLYPSRMAEVLDEEALSHYQSYLAGLLKQYAEGKTPGTYYALLLADGDNMGKQLDALETAERHQDLSQKLSAFAAKAHKIIQQHNGTPIYLGGDDIMAYLPLHTALDCMQVLGETFSSTIDNGTLSGSLVIAHHLEPLSEVLQRARAGEKCAKDVDGKNGLCIIYSKRSGADREIVAKWPDLLKRLQRLAHYHRLRILSRGAAYELQQMYDRLQGIDLAPDKQKDMMNAEALRIIRRKRQSGGHEDLPKAVRECLETWLQEISIKELAQEMIVALEFAKAQDLANAPLANFPECKEAAK